MTRINIGLELNNENRVVAWALDYPGCFAYGEDDAQAIIALAPALVQYQQWVNRHAGKTLLQLGDFDLRLVDTWAVYSMDDAYEESENGYAVNAWFKQDWKPLSAQDVQFGLQLFAWSREDLLFVLDSLSAQQMDEKYEGERWSIAGIARHIANAEWWYLDRLNLTDQPLESLPSELIARLTAVRARLIAVLPELTEKEQVLGVQGEFWSPRKLLRRTLWHEIDHREHILRLSGLLKRD